MTLPRKLSKKSWERQMLIIVQTIRNMCGNNKCRMQVRLNLSDESRRTDGLLQRWPVSPD
jgi:hypothetical protein